MQHYACFAGFGGPLRLIKPSRARARERGAPELIDAMLTVSASEVVAWCR
jgi:hypothetical protein